jgi:hypothetical protein
VREEVRLLQLDAYFGPHVYGAIDDYKSFSKAKVIERILETNALPGERLLGLATATGDSRTSRRGRYGRGRRSDEANRSGKPDHGSAIG